MHRSQVIARSSICSRATIGVAASRGLTRLTSTATLSSKAVTTPLQFSARYSLVASAPIHASSSSSNHSRDRPSAFYTASSPLASSYALHAFPYRAYSTDKKPEAPKVEQPEYLLPHPIWQNEYIDAVEITHNKPKNLTDKLALWTVRLFRFNFDWMSGYMFGGMTETKWLNRIVFLETVAGVPGFVAGMLRHLGSLRRMRRDYGWIHTLVEEAENERIHLLTALQLKQPSKMFRMAVWLTQGIFANWFFFTYLVFPTYCHRFVGYLEEEAVRTYTRTLKEIDTEDGSLHHWARTPAPSVARRYWKLGDNATMRDVVLVIRADESHHRDVNHTLADLDREKHNPFLPGKHERHSWEEPKSDEKKQ